MTKRQQYILFGVLGLSLAANLFVLGGYAWGKARWGEYRSMTTSERLMRMEAHVLDELSPQDADVAKAIFAQRHDALVNAMNVLRDSRYPMLRHLAQGVVNPQELRTTLERSQTAAAQLNEQLHGLAFDLSMGLSAQARQELAEEWGARHNRRGGKGRRR